MMSADTFSWVPLGVSLLALAAALILGGRE